MLPVLSLLKSLYSMVDRIRHPQYRKSDVDVLFIATSDVHDFCKKYPALALQGIEC